MLAALFFGISRCASPNLCPDDESLVAAVRNRDDATVTAISDQAAKEHPEYITFVHSERIKGVSDVICGEPVSGESLAVNCKFTICYWTRNAYLVARLVKKDGKWEIEEDLDVSRKRN